MDINVQESVLFPLFGCRIVAGSEITQGLPLVLSKALLNSGIGFVEFSWIARVEYT